MYFIPMGILLKDKAAVRDAAGVDLAALDNLTWSGFLIDNLLPVTIGNIIGGGLLVAAIYWLVYLRPKESGRR
jgi:formate/nitrite transporter FocA (FNT family)